MAGNGSQATRFPTVDQPEADVKADFSRIYTCDCPREYYRVLYGLDYIIPDLAKGVFKGAIRALETLRNRPIKVLDVGCSYGNNAILMRLPLDFHRLAQRYSDLDGIEISPSALAELDRNYLKSWPQQSVNVIGLDTSEPAVAYAKSIGAIDDGLVLDLEDGEVPESARALLRDVDLIVSTGCVGYVSEKTFARLLEVIDGPKPWVASFVLRMYPYSGIEDELAKHGLTTEKLNGVTFIQRRFHSKEECNKVLAILEQAGVPTEDKEAEGLYHAEFFLSRPEADAGAMCLEQIANVTTGARHAFGRRYRRDGNNILKLSR